MKKIEEDILHFFRNQNYTIISTIDAKGRPHSSCKGIVEITSGGEAYLLDLYKGDTFKNLKRNKAISITAIDEHKFVGYSLKGKAEILQGEELSPEILKLWEDKVTSRLTARLIRNLHDEKGHKSHPEILLPKPKYIIVVNVDEIVDLTPEHIKAGSS